jgi:hypothetical protein
MPIPIVHEWVFIDESFGLTLPREARRRRGDQPPRQDLDPPADKRHVMLKRASVSRDYARTQSPLSRRGLDGGPLPLPHPLMRPSRSHALMTALGASAASTSETLEQPFIG